MKNLILLVCVQNKSDKNKVNRSKSQIIHTTGRVSMAKHRIDMVIMHFIFKYFFIFYEYISLFYFLINIFLIDYTLKSPVQN